MELDANTVRGASRWLLAIDTSTEQAGIALYDGTHILEYSWPGGRQQTVSVLPAIERLLDDARITLAEIGAVAVATGPGSFTGLRVGLSMAKGLAIDGERAVIGVPTLDVTAAPHRMFGIPVVALVPAGRGRVVWAAYPTHGGASPVTNSSFDEFVATLEAHRYSAVVGELSPQQRARIDSIGVRVASPALSVRRPAVLAEIAYLRWQLGDVDEPTTLEPLYVHGQPNPR